MNSNININYIVDGEKHSIEAVKVSFGLTSTVTFLEDVYNVLLQNLAHRCSAIEPFFHAVFKIEKLSNIDPLEHAGEILNEDIYIIKRMNSINLIFNNPDKTSALIETYQDDENLISLYVQSKNNWINYHEVLRSLIIYVTSTFKSAVKWIEMEFIDKFISINQNSCIDEIVKNNNKYFSTKYFKKDSDYELFTKKYYPHSPAINYNAIESWKLSCDYNGNITINNIMTRMYIQECDVLLFRIEVDEILNKMYNNNKRFLSEILTNEAKTLINL